MMGARIGSSRCVRASLSSLCVSFTMLLIDDLRSLHITFGRLVRLLSILQGTSRYQKSSTADLVPLMLTC